MPPVSRRVEGACSLPVGGIGWTGEEDSMMCEGGGGEDVERMEDDSGDGAATSMTTGFDCRQYQVDLIEVAIRENAILCLPTGAGKTFIALKVSEHFLADNSGKQKVIFLAPSVPLVTQQAEFFRKHLPPGCSVIKLVGEMGVDYYKKEEWSTILAASNVIVMTISLLKRALEYKNILWEQICLLILDECHNATGDSDMGKIMDLYKQVRENNKRNPKDSPVPLPRVLGLTATIAKGVVKMKIDAVSSEIEGLQNRLCAKAVTHPNFEEISKFSTNAKIIPYRLPPQKFSSTDSVCKELNDIIDLLLRVGNLEDGKGVTPTVVKHFSLTSREQLFNRKATINESVTKVMKDILNIYTELGPYCACIAARIRLFQLLKYIDEVESKLGREAEGHRAPRYLHLAETSILTFTRKLERLMSGLNAKMAMDKDLGYYPNLQSMNIRSFVSEKIDAVLKILKKKRPSELKENEEPLCGILFCETRLTTQVCNWFLQDLTECCEEFSFLKVDFVFGSAGKNLDIEEGRSISKRQTDVLKKFRSKELNLIVTTSVLEEGLDIPSCNTVIRFDVIKNYPSFIQSMGRARMKDAQFHALIPFNQYDGEMRKIKEFQEFSHNLSETLAKKLESVFDEEIEVTDSKEPEVPAFSPGGNPNSPRLTETTFIPAVFRYCSLQKSDGISIPTPVSWCESIGDKYKAYLRFPCNTPIRDVIEGQPMNSKTAAKRSVFREACVLLYQAGEFDESLLPRRENKELLVNEFLNTLAQENEKRQSTGSRGTNAKLGTKKYTEVYAKSNPLETLATPIMAGSPVYVHEIELTFQPLPSEKNVKPNYRFDFRKHPYNFGFISMSSFTKIPTFHLQTETGRIKVRLVVPDAPVILSEGQLWTVLQFQKFMVDYVYGVPNVNMIEAKNDPKLLVAPIKKGKIDFEKMLELGGFRLENYTKQCSSSIRKNFHFNKNLYKDAVVIPWYKRPANKPTLFWVGEVSANLNSKSPMKLKFGTDYLNHYFNRWEVEILQPELPILRCHAVATRGYFLKCQNVPKNASCGSGGTVFDFPPELVNVSPIPACLLLQGKYLMSITHRLHRLLLASCIQQEVGKLFDWNVDRNAADEEKTVDYSENKEKECPNGHQKSCEESASNLAETLEKANLNSSSYAAGINFVHPKAYTWEQLQVAVKRMNGLNVGDKPWKSARNKKNTVLPGEVAPIARNVSVDLIDIESVTFNLDMKTDFKKVKGPDLFDIMEAITLANSNDYMCLEVKEMLGDSILKIVASNHVFTNFAMWKEGKMTSVRNQLISNEHLCSVAQKRNVGSWLGAGIFRPEEWVPPGYCVKEKCSVVLDDNKNNKKLKIMPSSMTHCEVSDKDIADATEALIGAYYLEGGLESALRFMTWIGLQGPDSTLENSGISSQPYSKEVSFRVPESAFMYSSRHDPKALVPFLDDLEKILCYKFNNKWILVEALTHPTFLRNSVTQSYQRLEFLGDAVLDFLITTHIFKRTGIKDPGRLTDLKSALVNNVTFGCLSVRYDFPLFMLHSSENLHNKIEAFSDFQRKQNYDVVDPYMLITDGETTLPCNVDIPKALGDLFEAIMGAIYIDSALSFDRVGKVVYRLMKREIDAFSQNIPINPVRKVMETYKQVVIKDIPMEGSDLKCVEIRINDVSPPIQARAVGSRKKFAKEAAAKLIFRNIIQQKPRKD